MRKNEKTMKNGTKKTMYDFFPIQLNIEHNVVNMDKESIFYYEMPLFNTDLMPELELDMKINTLSSMLSIFPIDSLQFFSYDKPVDLKQNVLHKEELKSKVFINDKQYIILNGIYTDYQKMENSFSHADKNVVCAFKLTKDEEALHFEVINEMLMSYGANRLGRSGLVTMWNVYLNRALKEIKDNEIYKFDMHGLLPDNIQFLSKRSLLQNQVRKVWAIKRYPKDIQGASLSSLVQMPNTHISIHLKVNTNDTDKMINQLAKQNQIRFNSSKKTEQLNSVNDEVRSAELFHELNEEKSKIFETTFFIEMIATTIEEMMKLEKKVEGQLKMLGFGIDKLGFQQQEAMHSAMPLVQNKLEHKHYSITSKGVAAFFPFSYTSKNDYTGFHLGKIQKGGDLFVDFYLRTANQLNGNCFIGGVPGAGKTVALQNILLQSIGDGNITFSIDPEGENGPLMKKSGGVDINVTDGKFKINIFEIRKFGTDEGKDEEENQEILLSNHISWMKNFFKTYKPDLTSGILDILEIYLFNFYHTSKVATLMLEEQYPIASDFYEYVEGDAFEVELITADEKRILLRTLHSLCKGVDSVLFNGKTNINTSKNINFNILALLTGGQERMQACLYNIITYIFTMAVNNRQQTLAADGKVKDIPQMLLSIDELYLLLNKYAPFLAIQLRDLMKRSRKYNLVILLATQNLIDLLQKDLIDYTLPLLSNPNKKMLLNPGAKELDIVKETFNLTDKETLKIQTAQRGEFLFLEGTNKYFVQSEDYLLPTVQEYIL